MGSKVIFMSFKVTIRRIEQSCIHCQDIIDKKTFHFKTNNERSKYSVRRRNMMTINIYKNLLDDISDLFRCINNRFHNQNEMLRTIRT